MTPQNSDAPVLAITMPQIQERCQAAQLHQL